MEVRPIIGDILAARIKDPQTDRVILEIKTNGKCQLMTPNVHRAHDVFCSNFEVPLSKRKAVLEGMQAGKIDHEFLHLILTKQLSYD